MLVTGEQGRGETKRQIIQICLTWEAIVYSQAMFLMMLAWTDVKTNIHSDHAQPPRGPQEAQEAVLYHEPTVLNSQSGNVNRGSPGLKLRLSVFVCSGETSLMVLNFPCSVLFPHRLNEFIF